MRIIVLTSIFALLMGTMWYGAQEINSFLQPSKSYVQKDANHGFYKEYYSNGVLKSQEEYFFGRRSGLRILFSERGDTLALENYRNGLKQDFSIYYTDQGERVLAEKFEEGELIDSKIINDSLFTYSYQIVDKGMMNFESNCSNCHQPEEVLNPEIDLNLPRLDESHICLMDSLLVEGKVDSSYFYLNDFDILSIDKFLETVEKETKTDYKRYLVSRKKRKKLVFSPVEY